MTYKDIKRADSLQASKLKALQAAVGTQAKLCRLLDIKVSTWCRRLEEPGEITINLYRKLIPLAKQYGIDLDPLGGIA